MLPQLTPERQHEKSVIQARMAQRWIGHVDSTATMLQCPCGVFYAPCQLRTGEQLRDGQRWFDLYAPCGCNYTWSGARNTDRHPGPRDAAARMALAIAQLPRIAGWVDRIDTDKLRDLMGCTRIDAAPWPRPLASSCQHLYGMALQPLSGPAEAFRILCTLHPRGHEPAWALRRIQEIVTDRRACQTCGRVLWPELVRQCRDRDGRLLCRACRPEPSLTPEDPELQELRIPSFDLEIEREPRDVSIARPLQRRLS